ncbi:DUF3124 domain-containing protein [Desertifilum sp. FACHB-1129]|uniref:DUF3124 domain-containing protein n=2 Tax=Desertifilum tharense IPPAS B-1220 TaxID=1781255 RepID=A0A1E5QKM4_9CYAN|nr:MULTISPECIES: DUF3124 domain-containing protein [unclassified Desertifilum]MDA0209747.1 DUF3124 domain-containing protein [Cyanobacteria bacterium FC1]OEJ75178.1 hypothetical protein BH720_10650 [Desertifilum tharense IPPAS B-1220]MBD2310762.1 DUF3124 domain-containing protein [Desertifilum sp. FACHB-1129]MBD2320799.1 DUF3124 domain-containing protein [Desertifilum sp. FACHB-866]MBD2330927.1 DUF3124 domain-containing protein [Desertifilum sp. FACHB-868]
MKLKQHFWVYWAIAAIALTACSIPTTSSNPQPSLERNTSLRAVTLDPTNVAIGQTVYVPVYSHIYHYSNQKHIINLSATLSIRNTDLTNSIIITSVRYYDTNGQLIRQDVQSPVELKPLASADFFIATDDTSGGSGANFIVEWVAEQTVFEPVIEAVMISTSSAQGISFVSPAKVLKQHGMQKSPELQQQTSRVSKAVLSQI